MLRQIWLHVALLIFSSNLYAGPKLQKELEVISDGLELTIDYGVLTFIAKPLFWLLDKIH